MRLRREPYNFTEKAEKSTLYKITITLTILFSILSIYILSK